MSSRDSIEPVYKKIGRAIQRARQQADMTQRELGKRLGMSREAITSIETGRQRIFVHTLLEIQQHLPHLGGNKYGKQPKQQRPK